MRSLRARLLGGMIGVQVVVLSLAGFFLLTFIRSVLYAEFDAALLREAEALSALVEEHDGRLMTELAEHDVSLLTGHQPIYQLRDSEGIVVETSSGWLDDQHGEVAVQGMMRECWVPNSHRLRLKLRRRRETRDHDKRTLVWVGNYS